MNQRGFYSILRWRADATRDEAHNVAVILVDPEGQFGGVLAAPISSLSPNLRQQGVLDGIVQGLSEQFQGEIKPDLNVLRDISTTLRHSLYVTEPRPAAVVDVDTTLRALYRAYVQPIGGGPSSLTKGVLLDRVTRALRRSGFRVRRGEYLGDFLFDVVVERPETPVVMDVLSFSTTAREWKGVEYDAGHFLFALQHVEATASAVVEPPGGNSNPSASISYDRITRWFTDAKIETKRLADLTTAQRAAR